MSEIRLMNDFKQAIGLLRDKNLVWSSEFDDIRLALADIIENKVELGKANDPALIELVQILISEENDLSV